MFIVVYILQKLKNEVEKNNQLVFIVITFKIQ